MGEGRGEKRAIRCSEPDAAVEVRGVDHKHSAQGADPEGDRDAPAKHHSGVDGNVDRWVSEEVLLEDDSNAC